MTLLPNPNFYKGRAKLDQIQIKFVPTPETALAALQTGDIDWYPDFSESDIPTVKRSNRLFISWLNLALILNITSSTSARPLALTEQRQELM